MGVAPDLASYSGSGSIGGSGYHADWDLNFDGVVDTLDFGILTAQGTRTAALRSGWVSDPGASSTGPDNSVGYCGYVFNPEREDYTVRFRVYAPRLGRWRQRDPIGYVDSANLLAYVDGRPTVYLDPLGLSPSQPNPIDGSAPPPLYDPQGFFEPSHKYNERRSPYKVNIFVCDRNLNTGGATGVDWLILTVVDALTNRRYIHVGDPESGKVEGFGLYDTKAKKGDKPDIENVPGLSPFNCKQCYRNGATLQNGSGAGKSSADATEAEIVDCIKNTLTRKDYGGVTYNCYDWVRDATKACGLDCSPAMQGGAGPMP